MTMVREAIYLYHGEMIEWSKIDLNKVNSNNNDVLRGGSIMGKSKGNNKVMEVKTNDRKRKTNKTQY